MCPICYKSFDNPDILQEHFNSKHHDLDDSASSSREDNVSAKSNNSFSIKEQPAIKPLNDSNKNSITSTNTELELRKEIAIWQEQLQLSEESRVKGDLF